MLHKAFVKMRKAHTQRGFTLVELLVVLTIVLIITTYSIAGYFPFMTKIEYENVVMDIALNVREHQLYGIGTKQDTANVFSYAYGFHVVPDGTGILFFKDSDPDIAPAGPSDTDGDGLHDDGMTCPPTAECLKLVSMNGYSVGAIGLLSGGVWTTSANPIDVTFKRPYLDAKILSGGVQYDQVNICVVDDADVVDRDLKIQIFRTGQISVVATTDPGVCQNT